MIPLHQGQQAQESADFSDESGIENQHLKKIRNRREPPNVADQSRCSSRYLTEAEIAGSPPDDVKIPHSCHPRSMRLPFRSLRRVRLRRSRTAPSEASRPPGHALSQPRHLGQGPGTVSSLELNARTIAQSFQTPPRNRSSLKAGEPLKPPPASQEEIRHLRRPHSIRCGDQRNL